MIVYDLDGNQSKWKMMGREINNDTRPRSELHKTARKLLKKRFPTLLLLEETPIHPVKGSTLYLDFYFPLRKLCVEVHGQQHFSFNSMFHITPKDFIKQKKNDKNKEEWCEINGITYLVFPYDKVNDWEDLL